MIVFYNFDMRASAKVCYAFLCTWGYPISKHSLKHRARSEVYSCGYSTTKGTKAEKKEAGLKARKQ